MINPIKIKIIINLELTKHKDLITFVITNL